MITIEISVTTSTPDEVSFYYNTNPLTKGQGVCWYYLAQYLGLNDHSSHREASQ